MLVEQSSKQDGKIYVSRYLCILWLGDDASTVGSFHMAFFMKVWLAGPSVVPFSEDLW